eukprot:GEMP01042219.1.p1 GENE.GEMP01042219.1~~GEMP01042219.1.p1  ORF type:complete len:289 (+),score=39.34 GEMP01042219.1:577-1443(+)
MGTVQWSSYDCEMPAERLIEATLAQNMIQIWILNIPLREEGKNEVIPLKPLLPNKTGVLKNLKVANATLGSIQCTLQKNAERNPLNCHTYDEILISDFVSRKDFFVDVYETLHIFILSEFLLNSWNIYLGDPPYTKQTELISDKDEHPGLISKRVAHGIAESEELPSLLNLRLQGNVIMNTSAELKQLQDAKIFSAHQAMLTFMEQQTPSVSEVGHEREGGVARHPSSHGTLARQAPLHRRLAMVHRWIMVGPNLVIMCDDAARSTSSSSVLWRPKLPLTRWRARLCC